MCRSWLFLFIWIKSEKYNNGQSWVLLYATKDDVRLCYKFVPYPLSTSSILETIQVGEKVLVYT
jgi:hypothetical protein